MESDLFWLSYRQKCKKKWRRECLEKQVGAFIGEVRLLEDLRYVCQ